MKQTKTNVNFNLYQTVWLKAWNDLDEKIDTLLWEKVDPRLWEIMSTEIGDKIGDPLHNILEDEFKKKHNS